MGGGGGVNNQHMSKIYIPHLITTMVKNYEPLNVPLTDLFHKEAGWVRGVGGGDGGRHGKRVR